MDIKSLLRTAGGFLEKNSPQILTGLGIAGVVSTAIMTGRAAVKAYDILEAERGRRLMEAAKENPSVTYNDVKHICWQDKVKLCWKPYVSPFLMGGTSIACILGAQSVNSKRNAALATVYSLTKSTLEEYQDKVVETIGEKKEELLRGEVDQKKLDSKPASGEHIIETGYGKVLCFDSLSGRYFRHNMEVIRRIVNDLNHDLLGVMWVPLNDFYYALGLEGIKLGDEIGWTVDDLIDIQFTSKVSDEGEPCLVLNYDVVPRGLKTLSWSGL